MGKRSTAVGVALVAVIIALSACSSSKRASAPGAPSSTSRSSVSTVAPRSTTTTSTPEFSFDDSVPPPKLINTGTNYVAILKSLEAYSSWIAAHRPDPSLVSVVDAPGTKLYDNFATNLTHFRDNNERLVETIRSPSQYEIVSMRPDAFSAKVVEDIASHRTVATTGRVTSERRFVGPTTYVMLMVLIRQHWYFASIDVQHQPIVHL